MKWLYENICNCSDGSKYEGIKGNNAIGFYKKIYISKTM